MEATLGRRGVARAVDAALALVVLYLVARVVPGERVLARAVLAVGAVGAYEALFVQQVRATPGKLATGLRVAHLGHAEVGTTAAWVRGVVSATGALALILLGPALVAMTETTASLLAGGAVVVVAGGYLMGILVGAGHRGLADRLARTAVVPFEAPPIVTAADLGLDDRAEPVAGPWGPLATPSERRRARLARLDDAPALVVGLVAVLLAWVLDPTTLIVLGGVDVPVVAAALTAAWVVALVADETWRVARDGGTAGHRRQGLAVVDEDTGEAPTAGRSLARAVVLAVFWLFPPLVPVLVAWVQLSRTGQGPHDLVAGTLVVADDLPAGGGR